MIIETNEFGVAGAAKQHYVLLVFGLILSTISLKKYVVFLKFKLIIYEGDYEYN